MLFASYSLYQQEEPLAVFKKENGNNFFRGRTWQCSLISI